MRPTYVFLDDTTAPAIYVTRSTVFTMRPISLALGFTVSSQFIYLTEKQAMDIADALYAHAEALSRAPEGEPDD